MQEEYSSIMNNDVWEVVPRPEGKSMVTSRWLYKVKHADGSIEKFKARFVARGFSQVEGVDYEETFAPVARYTSIRSIISIAAEMGWKIHQMDVKTAFLNGFIQEEVYIEHPQGFEFEMKDIGLMHYFLGLEVWQEEGHFFLGQGKYIVDILSIFHMEDCRPMSTPMITNWKKLHASDSELVDPTLYRKLIGSLMYLVNTRPDIRFAINTMSQCMCEPRKVHWVAAKHILRYLQGIVNYGLDYRQGDGVRLAGYTDSDWTGCASDRKSTSRCCHGSARSSSE
eukprot:PITA_21226